MGGTTVESVPPLLPLFPFQNMIDDDGWMLLFVVDKIVVGEEQLFTVMT
jgi:hypothetical protein